MSKLRLPEKQVPTTLTLPGCQLVPKGAIFEKNLTLSQWQAIGGTICYLEKSVLFWIGDWINYGEKSYGEKYAQALDDTGYEQQTLENAAWVARNVEISRRRENLTFSHHQEVASLEPKDQERWLDIAEKNMLTRRELRSEIQKQKFQEKVKLPTSKYRVIYADPPWQYSDKLIEGYGAAEHHYPTMSIQELCAMPIPGILDDDAVLFLWVTSPFLKECFFVIDSWGFEYKSSFVWDKIKHNMGHYNSVRHEFLLICTKGHCTPEIKKLYDSVVSVERSDKHSEKPEDFRSMIDTLYPSGKRLELFSRKPVKNWDAYGNE